MIVDNSKICFQVFTDNKTIEQAHDKTCTKTEATREDSD